MSVVRVSVVVEGPTEEQFVRRFLAHHFAPRSIYLTPIRVGRATNKANPGGGLTGYDRARRDLLRLLGDASAFVTTMFDLYGLPADFPGKASIPPQARGREKALHVERALAEDVQHPVRFVPYLQLHEFEALLFSDVEILDEVLRVDHRASLLDELHGILDACGEPEDINDHPETAPSKRLMKLTDARYSKVLNGFTVAERTGLAALRARCPHFDAWISRLESLSPLSPQSPDL